MGIHLLEKLEGGKFRPSKIISEVLRINIQGMTCQSCVKLIKAELSGVSGVKSVEISLEKSEGVVEIDLEELNGYKVVEIIQKVANEKFTANISEPEKAE